MQSERLKLIFIMMVVWAALGVGGEARAQETGWTEPRMLYQSLYHVTNPLVTADAEGVVHVFWVEQADVGNEQEVVPTVFHISLDEDGWNKPASVLLTPGGGSISGVEVASDLAGRLHLIWQGPNNALYYSQAEAAEAHDARSWSEPKILVTSFTQAGIATEGEDTLHVAYPGTGQSGLFYIMSEDGGETWLVEKQVSAPIDEDTAVNYVQVAASKGLVHVTWTEFKYPLGTPPTGVFYARSEDGGKNWSEPVWMASEGYDQIAVRTSADGHTHVVWNGMVAVGGRYYRESRDGGKTWGNEEEVIEAGLGGTSGYPQLEFDSGGVKQFVTTYDTADGGGIHHSYFDEGSWTIPVLLSTGFERSDYKTYSIELPRMAVSHGNRLHVVYEVGFKEIYYQTLRTEAREVAPPGVTIRPTATEIPIPPMATSEPPKPTVTPAMTFNDDDTSKTNYAGLPILLGAALVVGLIISVAYLRRRGA
jgi:hypothetical protein